MHAALARSDQPEFAPEPVDPFYLRGVCHLVVTRAAVAVSELKRRLPQFPLDVAKQATEAMACLRATEEIGRQLRRLSRPGLRIRVHGDFHLGQVLDTGDDLVIIDFEGDSSRPLSETQNQSIFSRRCGEHVAFVPVRGEQLTVQYSCRGFCVGPSAR
jgi:maltose alpha-D-glucosyltransferase / alpha-amylase